VEQEGGSRRLLDGDAEATGVQIGGEMMKVRKVIVDELPESCNGCPFSLQGNGEYFCCTRNVLLEQSELSIENMIHKRPDWCPLITSHEEYRQQAQATLDWVNAYIDKLQKRDQ
jgi:hypothetical protein